MKKLVVAGVLAAALAWKLGWLGGDHTGRIEFVKDYAAGRAIAERDGRPMMVYFTAPW